MTAVQNDPKSNLAAPVVNTPQSHKAYYAHAGRSLRVELEEGEGGRLTPDGFQFDFHPSGPMGTYKNLHDRHFWQNLSPGPHQLHAVSKRQDQDNSPWTFVEWFYVLTPPATSSLDYAPHKIEDRSS